MAQEASTIEMRTTEMHTGGMPVRVVTSGFPEVNASSYLERWRIIKKDYDNYRARVMCEPRGHRNMFGALLTEPDTPEADIGIYFIDSKGFANMCGHATISLGRYIVDNDLHKNKEVKTSSEGKRSVETTLQCPCGLIKVEVQLLPTNKSGNVSFTSVPSFLFSKDVQLETASFGTLTVNISFGGSFYVIIEASKLGLNLKNSPSLQLSAAADEITKAATKSIPLKHPELPDLEYYYGTILTDGNYVYSAEPTRNICIFGDKAVDRSPCGSGVTAQCAFQYGAGFLKPGQERIFENGKTGSQFRAMVVEEMKYGGHNGVRVRVTGRAYYAGTSIFTIEDDDMLKDGFLIN